MFFTAWYMLDTSSYHIVFGHRTIQRTTEQLKCHCCNQTRKQMICRVGESIWTCNDCWENIRVAKRN